MALTAKWPVQSGQIPNTHYTGSGPMRGIRLVYKKHPNSRRQILIKYVHVLHLCSLL